jgi:hypothetical protein
MMIGPSVSWDSATTVVVVGSLTGTTTVSSISYSTNEWWPVAVLHSPPERYFDRSESRPWVASSVAGRIPVVVELRAWRVEVTQRRPPGQRRRPTWEASLRAYHRDPRGLSREAPRAPEE